MRFDRALLNVDLYAVLRVPPHATPDEIRRAYRRLVSVSHPDLNPNGVRRAERRMAQINIAAGVLLDASRRATYDRLRRERSDRARDDARDRGAPHASPVDASKVRLDAQDWSTIEHFRSPPSRWFASFDSWTESWSPASRVKFVVASMALAIGLIQLARPTSLPLPFEEARPSPVEPGIARPT
jgi:curved DNA-binding protein CbpA